MGTMLGCRRVQPTLPFADELAELGRVFAVAIAQHLDGHHGAGLAMHGAEHPRKLPLPTRYSTL